MSEYILKHTGEQIDAGIEKANSALSDSGWHDLVLQNGTLMSGGVTPRYRKIGNVVTTSGRIVPRTEEAVVFATLPAGFRPEQLHSFGTMPTSDNASLMRRVTISATTGECIISFRHENSVPGATANLAYPIHFSFIT